MSTATLPSKNFSLHEVFSYHIDENLCQISTASYDDGDTCSAIDNSYQCANQELQLLRLPDETMILLQLVPIVHVAWADGGMRTDQVFRVIETLRSNGFVGNTNSLKLLRQWLAARPDEVMFTVWHDYVSALQRVMSNEAYDSLRQYAIDSGRATAEAMGPCFGLLNQTASHETAVRQIEGAFESLS